MTIQAFTPLQAGCRCVSISILHFGWKDSWLLHFLQQHYYVTREQFCRPLQHPMLQYPKDTKETIDNSSVILSNTLLKQQNQNMNLKPTCIFTLFSKRHKAFPRNYMILISKNLLHKATKVIILSKTILDHNPVSLAFTKH